MILGGGRGGSEFTGGAGVGGRAIFWAAGEGAETVGALLRNHTAPPRTAELIRADNTIVSGKDGPGRRFTALLKKPRIVSQSRRSRVYVFTHKVLIL